MNPFLTILSEEWTERRHHNEQEQLHWSNPYPQDTEKMEQRISAEGVAEYREQRVSQVITLLKVHWDS